MKIRSAKADDFHGINNLMLEFNEKDTDQNIAARRKVFQSIVEDNSNYIIVGVLEEKIVTTCYLNIIPNITWGPAPYALIENVVTSMQFRRNGYGRECVRHAIEIAFSEGCFKVMLSSSQRNDKTREFYGSVGLQQSKDGYVIYKQFI